MGASMAGVARNKASAGLRQRTTKASRRPADRTVATAKAGQSSSSAVGKRAVKAAAKTDAKVAAKPAAQAAVKPAARKRPASRPLAEDKGASAPVASSVRLSGERLGQIQGEYLQRLAGLMNGDPTHTGDRRFAGDLWRQGPFAWTANLYTLNAEFMQRLAEAVEGDALSRERIRFATQQWVDAMSPANFLLTNPEAQQRLIETRGESLRQGVQNLLADLNRGRISHTDEAAFEVGRNVATTPGSVVYQNELFQLIQYEPSTAQVGARPLLMVPPCINKFYILDLQPGNSLVAYAVSQGHTVFMVSWKNIKADQDTVTWDDYLERGVIDAVRVVREICGQARINVLGFCVGGTLLAAAAAALAARGERPIESMTLLTTFLDFSDPGVLGVFIDEGFVAYRESTIGKKGIMPGRELAATFNALRPNDLVWNYVVSNYLKGEAPPAFDLLYWNADSTNLPGPMYCWYLRHMYLQNELREPGRLICAGVPIDLGEIDVPTFIYGSREDHIVPWRGAYASTQLLAGPLRFVLGASGHIAGVINPASRGKRSHWVGNDDALPESADDWFANATERPGSWWSEWAQWLAGFAGGSRPAPAQPGGAHYRAIEPAPGQYVKEKAE